MSVAVRPAGRAQGSPGVGECCWASFLRRLQEGHLMEVSSVPLPPPLLPRASPLKGLGRQVRKPGQARPAQAGGRTGWL